MTASAPPGWLTDETVQQQLGELERRLAEGLSDPDERVQGVLTHLIGHGGKRLRPALLLTCARLGDADTDLALDLAVAVEWLHTATLYHDDIMDQGFERRGHPSANARWGNRPAGFAANVLYARAAGRFAQAGGDFNRAFGQAVFALWQGQMRETEAAFDLSVDEAHYLTVIEQKTATLCELPCEAGALAAGLEPPEVERLRGYGRRIGVAFQLADDLLDLFGTMAELGKQPRADLREGIYTLPVIRALAARDETASRLRRLLEAGALTGADEEEFVACLSAHPATAQAIDLLRQLVDEARALIAPLPANPTKASLANFADTVARRLPSALKPTGGRA